MTAIWSRLVALREAPALALVALVTANAIPLVGVLFLGWDVSSILIVYWLENGVVGAFNVAKLMTVRGPSGQVSGLERAAKVPFFVLHYGIFWLVHGVFVLTLPAIMAGTGTTSTALGVEGMLLAVCGLAIAHAVTFWLDRMRGGDRDRTTLDAQVNAPYPRIIVLHLTIIVGAMGAFMLGQPAFLVALLVVFKTTLDALIYVQARQAAPTR